MSSAIQSLWQHQGLRLEKLSPDEVRRQADEALAADRRYKAVGLMTASLLLACFGLFFLVSQTTMGRIGAAVGIGAGLFMSYRADRLMKTHPLLSGAFGIDAYRRILQREQQALIICWQTMLLVQLGVALNLLGGSGFGARSIVGTVATVTPVLLVAVLTHLKARAYGRRARELDHP